MRIVLFNLNNYIGGGELLLVRLAQHLKKIGENYQILGFKNSWIEGQASSLSLRFVRWPSGCDSVNYMRQSEKSSLIQDIENIYARETDVRIFVFCMRDAHNSLYIASKLRSKKIILSYGLYHPEDALYLATLSLNSRELIKTNRQVIRAFLSNDSMLFTSPPGFKFSLTNHDQEKYLNQAKFISLPIEISPLPLKKTPNANDEFRIICISRFVEFKVASILAIMKAVHKQEELSLTIVGYGFWEFILRIWMFQKKPKNISLIGAIDPDELDAVIDTHDIGYAQGTSILEIAKRGLPVLVAPYSRISDVFGGSVGTLGVFGCVPKEVELGDSRYFDPRQTTDIRSLIFAVRRDFRRYADSSAAAVRAYDSDVICGKIHQFILTSRLSAFDFDFHPPTAPFLKIVRFYFKKVVKKWQ